MPQATGLFKRPDVITDTLYAITPIINVQRFRTRWKNKEDYIKAITCKGIHLITVEAAYNQREFVFKTPVNDRHTIINVRTRGELWIKESLQNRGIQELTRLFPDWKYVCMIDGDLTFVRPDITGETLQKLQHHPVVQMYSEIGYLGHDNQMIGKPRLSFAERWMRGHLITVNGSSTQNGVQFHKNKKKDIGYGEWGTPGGAWAYRRAEFNDVGGLLDVCILGSGDTMMATGLIGFCKEALPNNFSPSLSEACLLWEQKALKVFRKNIGVVSGLVLHSWHGRLSDRNYGKRNKMLKENDFNPFKDLIRNVDGVYELFDDGSERMRLLRDQIREYSAIRNEDNIEQ